MASLEIVSSVTVFYKSGTTAFGGRGVVSGVSTNFLGCPPIAGAACRGYGEASLFGSVRLVSTEAGAAASGAAAGGVREGGHDGSTTDRVVSGGAGRIIVNGDGHESGGEASSSNSGSDQKAKAKASKRRRDNKKKKKAAEAAAAAEASSGSETTEEFRPSAVLKGGQPIGADKGSYFVGGERAAATSKGGALAQPPGKGIGTDRSKSNKKAKNSKKLKPRGREGTPAAAAAADVPAEGSSVDLNTLEGGSLTGSERGADAVPLSMPKAKQKKKKKRRSGSREKGKTHQNEDGIDTIEGARHTDTGAGEGREKRRRRLWLPCAAACCTKEKRPLIRNCCTEKLLHRNSST